jgi:hypothetical protein
VGAFAVGDRVWYVIAGLGNVPPIWLAVVVVQVTATRVGVQTSPRKRPRFVSPARLTTETPPPDVTTLVFPPVVVTGPDGGRPWWHGDWRRAKVTRARKPKRGDVWPM